jgi:hypothetical protein
VHSTSGKLQGAPESGRWRKYSPLKKELLALILLRLCVTQVGVQHRVNRAASNACTHHDACTSPVLLVVALEIVSSTFPLQSPAALEEHTG